MLRFPLDAVAHGERDPGCIGQVGQTERALSFPLAAFDERGQRCPVSLVLLRRDFFLSPPLAKQEPLEVVNDARLVGADDLDVFLRIAGRSRRDV